MKQVCLCLMIKSNGTVMKRISRKEALELSTKTLLDAERERDDLDEYDEAMKPGAWKVYDSLMEQGLIEGG